MGSSDRHKFCSFAIKYNVILLGGFYFLVLSLIVLRLTDSYRGIFDVWHILAYLVSPVLSFIAWIYCIRKSWTLTNFDHRFRIAIIAYLFGAPAVLVLVTGDVALYLVQTQGMWLDPQ